MSFPSLLAQILVPVLGLARCLLLSVGRGSGPVLQMLLMQVTQLHPSFLTSLHALLLKKQGQPGLMSSCHCYLMPLKTLCWAHPEFHT